MITTLHHLHHLSVLSFLRIIRFILLTFIVFLLPQPFFITGSALAASQHLDSSPVEECEKGVELFLEGKYDEAIPLLEAGYSNRDKASFAQKDDLGKCALALGIIYHSMGKTNEGLEADLVALQAFKESDNLEFQGNAYHAIGAVYNRQGRFDEALDAYQQSLAIARKIGDRTGESPTLNNIGGAFYAQGKYDKALEAYKEALAIAQEVGDQSNEASALNGISGIYYVRGQYSEAMKYTQQALIIVQGSGDQIGEATTLSNIGSLYNDQGQYAEALQNHQKSLEIVQKLGDRVSEGQELNYIGMAYLELGQYEKARENLQQALKIAREVSDRASESQTLINIGALYSDQGDYAKALEYYQQSLEIASDIGDREDESNVLVHIGILYKLQGRYAESLEYYHKALSIQRELGSRADEPISLNNIGTVYDKQGHFDEALESYMQALEIYREVGDQGGEGRVLSNIGLVFEQQRKHDLALTYYQQALDILRTINDQEGESQVLNNIGGIYDNQAKYSQALDYYQQALEIVQKLGNRVSEGSILTNIGWINARTGNYVDAQKNYELAMSIFESIRSTLDTESARASFIAEHSNVYNLAIGLYIEQNQPRQAFLTSERGRARAFLDSVATGYVELSDTQAVALFNNVEEAYAIRQSTQNAISRAKAQKPPDENLISDLEMELTQSEANYQAALDAITARHDQLSQLIPGRSSVLDVNQVQRLLDNETSLLSFWVMDDQTLVFILTKDTVDVVPLRISRITLHNQIEAFRHFDNVEATYPASAVELYKFIFEPIKAYIKNPHLIIIPQGELHYLPFATLTDGKHFLADDYVITYLPSASTLPFIQQNAENNSGEDSLILGNPATGDYDSFATLANERDRFGPLPFAEEEANDIAIQLGTQPYIKAIATETLVKKQAAQTKILHLAAHGLFNPIAPLSSFIALAPDQENDGWLTVREIYGLDLKNADLVTLSACDTQIGTLTVGDEFVGLTRALFFAGTPTVVASLWSVDDKATAFLMERFYAYLSVGISKGEALRQAQIDTREQYPNPYYWAAFVLTGDSGGGVTGGMHDEVTETPIPIQTPTSVPFPNCGFVPILILLSICLVQFSKKTNDGLKPC